MDRLRKGKWVSRCMDGMDRGINGTWIGRQVDT